uniref:Protein phosphatase n=1 Tax=Glycine max TaxID=3847 RepID=A0A0R0EWQ2_SOYBN
MAVCEGEGVLRLKRETMAIPMLRAAMISHSQSQPLIHSISAIYETAKRRKRVVFSSSSSELNPVIRSEVSFCVGTCLIPHPKKVNTGGEDAFFVSNYNGGVIAVADGVSGWAEEDVDPSLFPRELLANASNFVGDEEQVNYDPQILIRKAHAATFSTGSATVIVAMLEKNGTLKIANVGDCGLRLIRNGHVVFSTSPQEHYFDCPFQLSSERVGQTYLDAAVCNVELIQGDTIVMGSDGLFDNVFDHEIVPTIVRYKDVAEAGIS